MAAARFPSSHAEITSRTWHLTAIECPDGRIALAGLPGPGDPPQPGHTLARFAAGRGPRRRWRLWDGEL